MGICGHFTNSRIVHAPFLSNYPSGILTIRPVFQTSKSVLPTQITVTLTLNVGIQKGRSNARVSKASLETELRVKVRNRIGDEVSFLSQTGCQL